MSLKIEFVERAAKPGARMSVLCREYGISRETGYKWLNRFKREGPDGLEERSRRPRASPLATAEDLVVAVLDVREAYPRRGPRSCSSCSRESLERLHRAWRRLLAS
jgi:transposase-like protein